MLSCHHHPRPNFPRNYPHKTHIFITGVSQPRAVRRHHNLHSHTVGRSRRTQAITRVRGLLQTATPETPAGKVRQLPNTSEFNRLLSSLLLADEFELASKLNSGSLFPDDLTYSTFITFCCKKDEPSLGEALLSQMLAQGFEPNIAAFTAVIDSLCVGGRIERAYKVLDVMSSIGCDPTIHTFNCLLKGLCYVGRVEEACELMANIKRTSLKPDIYTYTTLMDGLCKVGRCKEASELLDEAMEGHLTPNAVTFNTLFNGYFKEGKPMRGFGLLRKMKEKNCTPDYVTYSTFLHGLLKWGKIKPALSIYTEMVRSNHRVDDRMSNALLRGLCRRSRKEKELLEAVYGLIEDMRRRECRIYHDSYDLVIEALCCNTRETGRILEALNESIEKGYSPKTFTFNLVIHTLCISGEIDEALNVLAMVHCHRKAKGIPFGALISELNRRGRFFDACLVYGVALKRGVLPRQKPIIRKYVCLEKKG